MDGPHLVLECYFLESGWHVGSGAEGSFSEWCIEKGGQVCVVGKCKRDLCKVERASRAHLQT